MLRCCNVAMLPDGFLGSEQLVRRGEGDEEAHEVDEGMAIRSFLIGKE